MQLSSEFIRLPLAFDVARLREEVLQFSEYQWDYHPQRFDGNTALNLVSKDGQRSDAYVGKMQGTEALEQCPYIKQIMASLGIVVGRSRLMRLAPGKGVPQHSDTDYTWRDRVRIHIPVITHPSIRFSSCGNIDVHMQAGEAWIFDNWREHAVYNDSDVQRIHLVIDTVGSAEFWQLAKSGLDPRVADSQWTKSIKQIDYQPQQDPSLQFEQHNLLPVRSPAEVASMCNDFLAEIDTLATTSPQLLQDTTEQLAALVQDWRALWAMYWDTQDAITHYQARVKTTKSWLQSQLGDTVLKSNGARAYDVIAGWLDMTTDSSVAKSVGSSAKRASRYASFSGKMPHFKQPIFIVAAPRSGSTMLFEALKNNKELWTIGDESHREIESIAELHPMAHDFSSNALSAQHCTAEIALAIKSAFMFRMQSVRSVPYTDVPAEFQPNEIRFLEKTPKNALRIPFFKEMFPDAKFVFLHRRAEPNIGSIIDAWNSKKFVTYPNLPGWSGPPWSLLLCDGWRRLHNKPLAHIAAHQWASTNAKIMHDLSSLPSSDRCVISYEGLLSDTQASMSALCEFMQIPFGPKMRSYADTGFPNSKYAISQPHQQKWLRHAEPISAVESVFQAVQQELDTFK